MTEEVKERNGTCKCRHCGTRTTKNMAFRKTIEEKRYYFCSREHYLLWQAEVDEEKKSNETFNAICDHVKYNLFGYDENQKMTEYFYTRIRDVRNGYTLNKLTLKKEKSSKGGYPYQVILATFKAQHETIMYWFRNKAFKNENQKTNYMMAIVESKLNDEYIKWKFEKERNKETENNLFADMNTNLEVAEQRKNEEANKKETEKKPTLADLYDELGW